MSDDRTYEPSEARREEFKRQGRYARARDAGPLAATVALVLLLDASRPAIAQGFRALFGSTIGDLGALERQGIGATLGAVGGPIALRIGGVILVSAIASVIASGSQTRFRLRWDAAKPNFDKLDVAASLKRLVSFRQNTVELLLSMARAGAVTIAAWHALAGHGAALLAASRAPLGEAVAITLSATGRVVFFGVVALVVLGALDYGQSWLKLEKDLKMTRQERMDEAKKEDGDPKVKARMRARARQNAKKRAIASVKNADVIVVNPTHVSVALRYGPKDPAPIVVAKGHDDVALRIRAEGRKYGVPILENRSLARALDAEVAVGKPVPQARYAAVAQVLAFVYRLKKRGAIR